MTDLKARAVPDDCRLRVPFPGLLLTGRPGPIRSRELLLPLVLMLMC